MLGAKVVICKPADPEAKGLVERFHDYLERSFLPGRTFASPADFNTQLAGWLQQANRRRKRVLGCAPADRVGADRQAMLSLPPVPRRSVGRLDPAATRPLRPPGLQRLLRSSRASSAGGSRSTPTWTGCGCLATGRSSPTTHGAGRRHQTITDPEHAAAAKALRAQRATALHHGAEPEVEIRALADYDTALGHRGRWPDGHHRSRGT